MAFPASEQSVDRSRVENPNAPFARIAVSDERTPEPATDAAKIALRGRYLHDLLLDPSWTGGCRRHRMIEMDRERPGAIRKHPKSDARNRHAGAIVPGESAQ